MVPGSGFVLGSWFWVRSSGFGVLGSGFSVLGSGFGVRHVKCLRHVHGRTTLSRTGLLAVVQRVETTRICVYCQTTGFEGFRILQTNPRLSSRCASNDFRRIWPISTAGIRPLSGIRSRVVDRNPESSRRCSRRRLHHNRSASRPVQARESRDRGND